MPFQQLSGFFRIFEGGFIKVTNYIISLLIEKSKLFIKWLVKEQYPVIAAEFNKNAWY